MNCQKCNNPGIENQANGKLFWFCRSCRIEIDEPKSGFKWVSDWMSLDSIGATKYTPPAGYNLVTHPNGNTAYLVPTVPQGVPTPLPVSQSPAQGPIQAPISPFYRLVKKSKGKPGTLTYSLHVSGRAVFVIRAGTYLVVADWLPAQDPQPGDNFCGVDRSVDPIWLAGIRFFPASALSVEEKIVDTSYLVARGGGTPNACFLPSKQFKELALYSSFGSMPPLVSNLGGMPLQTSYGRVLCYEDPTLASDTAFLLQMDTWEEIGGTLVCKTPGYNARIKLI